MGLARVYASFSEDESRKVGAVIVGLDNDQKSEGWNGLCRGVENTEARNSRPTKYLFYEHAERNAIYNATRKGVALRDSTIYITHAPCADCARAIIQSGITRVFYAEGLDGENWIEHNAASIQMFYESGVLVEQCLQLPDSDASLRD